MINTVSINGNNAIITFDYEVFLGRQTGTIENCVIKPTRSILKILKENNAKAIFFVDATWLLFLRENFPDDLKLVTEQLKSIIATGSSVELHLHPHWVQAYRTEDKILFKSFENYRLHSLSQEGILDLFRKSIELLESITLQKIRCFRAGGFCIEPFDQIKNAFETFDIKYDFSVATGMQLKGGNEYDYDFSDSPNLPFYHFNYDVKKPEPEGQFVEIPLSTYKNNPVYRIINKVLLKLYNDKIFGDGKSIQETSYYLFKSFYRRLKFSTNILTINKTSTAIFRNQLRNHFKRYRLLVIVSHPKTMSKLALDNLSHITKNHNTLNSFDLDNLLIS
jgi:hypothetical protein